MAEGIPFFGVDLDQEMVYEDGRVISFREHVVNLRNLLGLKDDKSLEETLSDFTLAYASSIAVGLNERHPFIGNLRKWTISVVAGAKAGPNGEKGFYPNLIFSLSSALDSTTTKRVHPVLRFTVSGMNARRACKGEKPGLHFMPTPRLIQVHDYLIGCQTVNKTTRRFHDKYKSLLKYEHGIETFNSAVRDAGISINFEKKKNPKTGANAYDLLKAFQDHASDVKEGKIRVVEKVVLEQLLEQLSGLELLFRDEPEGFASLVAKWNLSEYASRLIVYSRVAGLPMSDSFFVNEIIARSMNGDFPGEEVNSDVAASPLSELYFLE